MSCEESYLAIIRYLTDEREPYAPGTPGNTKRKIRKAATCYVVRSGTLFYQRRLKGQNDFTELEVVLQDSRRKELINEAHVMCEGGEHLNQQLTWESISQKYWWRGEWTDAAGCELGESHRDVELKRARAEACNVKINTPPGTDTHRWSTAPSGG